MAKAIQDNDPLYNLLSPLVQYGCRCHYNSFVVRGLDSLPTDGSYIIAPCHQQALMEPLAVLCFAPKPPVFLARADLFRQPTLRKVLTFLKIMPVYRIRDGQDQLGLNREIFDRCRDVLLDGFPLCLMAEGRHNNRHHLLPMGKGMFRIAAETQLALGERPLYIVPTGIDFDEYEQPYSNLVVNIGRPIPVRPFIEGAQGADDPHALNNMRNALAEALLPLMHDIRSDEHYDTVMTLCNAMNPTVRRREGLKNNAWNRFRMRQLVATEAAVLLAACDGRFERLTAACDRYSALCRTLRVSEKTVAEHWSLAAALFSAMVVAGVLAFIVAAAVSQSHIGIVAQSALFCLLCYPIPLLPTHLAVRRRVADPQFRSSFNWGVRFFGSIVWAIVIGVVMACTGGLWMGGVLPLGAWWGLVAVAVVVLGARLTAPFCTFLRRTFGSLRWHWLRLTRRGRCRELDACLATMAEYFSGRTQ